MARKDGGNIFGGLCCLNALWVFVRGGGCFVLRCCLVFLVFFFILWFFGIFCFEGRKNLKVVFSVLQELVVFLLTSKAPECLANRFLQKHPHKESAEVINQKNWCQPWTNNCVSW